MPANASPSLLAYRCAVLSRVLAAGPAGYLFAYTATTLSAHLLLRVVTRADAALGATMIGFLVYAIAVLVVFACANARRAWAWVLGGALLCYGLDRLLMGAAS
ncbi:hypothetical protein CAL29_30860 [Bordetella genomosp. 10]|uniref:Iron transporter n=1 Tax=Bordetella genomosp. 10 TaxID=1416804 RepID=A0A261S4D9_9BORD|nr:hypothetical protein [Bordetella genomosp. 10]OZI32219.1 hypothetical protein CAL29_30860 [Bordetella genomosp. 10]